MAFNDSDKPGLACIGISAIIFIVSLILHAYAAFSPYFDWTEYYDDWDWRGERQTRHRDHHNQRNAIAIPTTILEAIFSLGAITRLTSCFAEQTALSLLGGCLALGCCLLGIVIGGVRNWPTATWLLFFVFWLTFALEFCLGPLGWLTNWAASDGPRRLILWARSAMRMMPPHSPGISETGDSYTFTEIPASPSQHRSPTLVGSPRHSNEDVDERIVNRVVN